jgi:hypothetical protein
MATKHEEDAEQAFFAEHMKGEHKMSTTHQGRRQGEGIQIRRALDSLGQENPAFNLERKNIADAIKRSEERKRSGKRG